MRHLLLTLLALAACETGNNVTFEQCELDLVLDPTTAAVGDPVEATGPLLTEPLDTAVRVDGVSAEVLDVTATDACAGCSACRDDAGCVCGTCDEVCGEACAECTRALTFTVPDLPAGAADVIVTNRFGTSEVLALEILPDAE